MTVSKILKLQGFVWKTMQAWLDGKSCFSRTNASNFWRPLQSLLLRFSGYLFLIHSFSLCWQNFSKVNCFRFYWKLITWSSHAKSLFIYYSYASLNYFLVDISLVLFFSLITFLQCTQVHLELNWWWWQCQKLSTSWSQLTKREMMSILTSKLHL